MPAPLIVSSSSTATGTTRQQYRRRLAEQLGEIAVLTTTSEPLTATTPDAARQILATGLGVDQLPEGHFDGAYVYVVNGTQTGEQRKVLAGTFDGPEASLLLDRPFSATLDSGTEIEITRPLPVVKHLLTKGLNDLVQEALERIWVEVRATVTGNGTYAYSLTSLPAFRRPEQSRGIYDESWLDATAEPELSANEERFSVTGASVTLIPDYAYTSAETFELAAIVRADRYVSDGSTWGYTTARPALTGDAYQAAALPEHVVAFGMVKGLQELRKQVRTDRTMDRAERNAVVAEIQREINAWAGACWRIKHHEFPRPQQRRTAGLVSAEPAAAWE